MLHGHGPICSCGCGANPSTMPASRQDFVTHWFAHDEIFDDGNGTNEKPICSTYGVFTYICPKNQPNVGEYTIHGAYGKWEIGESCDLINGI